MLCLLASSVGNRALLRIFPALHPQSFVRMADCYNFGIELEMIVTPHQPRGYGLYPTGTNPMEYYISFYERLAKAMVSRRLKAEARTASSYKARQGLEGWFITSDRSVRNEDGSVPVPPRSKFSFFRGLLQKVLTIISSQPRSRVRHSANEFAMAHRD
jgi:hypothetical protein